MSVAMGSYLALSFGDVRPIRTAGSTNGVNAMAPEFEDLLGKRIELLLDEKRYVDTQVSKCLELQLKITGVHFTALAAAAGWIFTKDSNPKYLAPSLLIIVALSCFGSAQSVIINALMLHYARYKHFVLGRQFAEALGLSESPLKSYAELANRRNPSRNLAAVGSVVSAAVALFVNAAALLYAFALNRHLLWWCVVAGLGVAVITLTQLALWQAQTRTYSDTLRTFGHGKRPNKTPVSATPMGT
jgi:phosphoglycerol transferase MdoB-like AlkP superfamily enzyme